MLGMALWLAWEDYDMRYIHTYRRHSAKFGYNYSKKGLWWILIGGFAPFVNLFVLAFFVCNWISTWWEERKQS
jgi:hypothetical protein